MASNHIARVTAGGLTNATITPSLYGYCTTAAATAAKTVTMYSTGTTAGAAWAAADLFHGLTITVRFQYSNTVANPTLNVNSTGAKPIYRYGTTAPSTSVTSSWNAQSVITFTYDTLLNTSGCWVMHNWLNNDNNNAVTQTATTTSANYEVLFSSTADNTTRTEGARKNSNLTFNPSTGNLHATMFNGYNLNTAAEYDVDNIMNADSINSSNLVTAGAVASILNSQAEISIGETTPNDTFKLWIQI